MSNEKLREALRIAVNYIDMDALYIVAGGDYDTIKEALATTEPEPTGMPELHPVAHIELGDDSHDVVTLEAAKAYGEQCWKAGYKHGAWADKPAVNQQLTTEPVDEREEFEREMKKRLTSPLSFDRHEANTNEYAYLTTAVAWYAWQARAAITKGVKG